jgi:hypothetical protein
MSGLILNRAGETVPELIGHLVYLSAWMVAAGKSFEDYRLSSEFATTKLASILVSDPLATGALRVDFRSADPDYRARIRAALAADVGDDSWAAASHLLTPDAPAGPTAEPVSVTAERWGRLSRTYITCTADEAVPLAAQRRFIEEADQLTPDNLTCVRPLASSHSPFLSQPEQLADILRHL